MYLKHLEISGFKSFAKKSILDFNTPVTAIVGPNGSGKSNVAEAIRFVLGEQSLKSMRGKRGEDLIFNGSNNTSRSNRAAVSIIFDNKDRKFSQKNESSLNIDYDEISLTREVFRDGSNKYSINGSQVRLKDILSFLSAMNIGSSGHHIISQGEADRILSANSKEKKTIIEDALGLKIYHYKKLDSQKKLEKTKKNIEQVQLQRKEIAPHIRFLKRQVEKIEKAQALRDELKNKYYEYLNKEEFYLNYQKKNISKNKEELQEKTTKLDQQLLELERKMSLVSSENTKLKELGELEGQLQEKRNVKDDVSRQMGRIEGIIELERRRNEERIKKEKDEENRTIPLGLVKKTFEKIKNKLQEVFSQENPVEMKDRIKELQEFVEEFLNNQASSPDNFFLENKTELELKEREIEKNKISQKLKKEIEDENQLIVFIAKIRKDIELEKDDYRDVEKNIFEIRNERNSLLSKLEIFKIKEDKITKEDQSFKEELREAVTLIGKDILKYTEILINENDIPKEEREIQENKHREIEKLKIRLEEMMGGESAEESLKEYQEVTERDQFLEREIDDLNKSAASLQLLIEELQEKLDVKFKEGIIKINEQFQNFFSTMFGGGTASLYLIKQKIKRNSDTNLDLDNYEENLNIEKEENEGEDGLEVEIALPRKKIRGLQMLSGGERALVSIALLFAISQVNPPPFLVLDETDAALDEANSRKYGEMLKNLSKFSQLIVITHNRETMGRAEVLYGVTMGADAASKLLSIKFEEAVEVAK